MSTLNIKICTHCNGRGQVKVDDRHSDIDSVECAKCLGTGRLYYRTYEIEVPLTQEQKFYKLDEDLMKIIRESRCQS